MESNESTAKSWRSAQVYGLAVVCLLSGIGIVKWRVQGDGKAAIAAWQRLLKAHPNHPKRAQVEELLSHAKQNP